MNPRLILSTARRVLAQLRHDRRTVGLLIAVPTVLLTLLSFVLDARPDTFDRVAPPLVGIFPLISMFLVTSITMVRERTTGTLERLLTMPIAKVDVLGGYALAFALVATVQAVVVGVAAFGPLGVDGPHGAPVVMALAVLNALLGTALGLFVSAFAATEFQAVQFMPAFVFPQLILCGLVVPRREMPAALEAVADRLPLTFAYDALERAARPGPLGSSVVIDVAVVAVLIVVALALGAATLRRQTA